jgi:hypothetical protein
MRIRLMGTRTEIAAAVDALRSVLEVREVSDFYPNRGASQLGRVYLDIDGVLSNPVPATATRADGSREIGGRRAIEGRRGGEQR